MDDVTKASFADLIRRLRVAGDKYVDLRCVLWHDLDLTEADLSCEFGELFRYSIFRPSDPDDCFHTGYYRESSRPSSFDRHKLLPLDRISELNESAKPIQKTLVSLFDDAMWLAGEVSFQGIPGCGELDFKSLRLSESTWLLLLFHAAWSCPGGSLLRAKRWYPKVLIARLRLRDKLCRSVGFTEDRLAWMSDADKLRDEIFKRNSKLTKEELESEWASIYDEECSQQREKVVVGEYMSILPLDPFTASAELLNLIVLSDPEIEATQDGEPFVPTTLQCSILAALDGKALKKQGLADVVCGGEGTRLYKAGGLKELRKTDPKLVDHKNGLGYYRPDRPPKQ